MVGVDVVVKTIKESTQGDYTALASLFREELGLPSLSKEARPGRQKRKAEDAMSNDDGAAGSMAAEGTAAPPLMGPDLGLTAQEIDQALARLNPKEHSLGWLFLLKLKQHTTETTMDTFASRVVPLCTDGNATQILRAPRQFTGVLRHYADLLIAAKRPAAGIATLRKALQLLQRSPQEITPLHPTFLQICLLAKHYKAGAALLDKPHFQLSPQSSGVDVLDVLTFTYYGGMIYIGEKRFEDALDMLSNCLSVPGTVVSRVVVEAMKKYVVVSLLLTGTFTPFPKYTPPPVHRYFDSKVDTEAYHELIAACEGNQKVDTLEAVIATRSNQFELDNNAGLVRQLVVSQRKRTIMRLTATYVTLSLESISERAGLGSARVAEEAILDMIASGHLAATIHQQDGVVSFSEDTSEAVSSTQMLATLQDKIAEASFYSQQLRDLDKSLELAPTFLAKQMRDKKASSIGSGLAMDRS